MAEPAARDRRGLGRGLASLLGDAEPVLGAPADGPRELPLDAIVPNPDQPRARHRGRRPRGARRLHPGVRRHPAGRGRAGAGADGHPRARRRRAPLAGRPASPGWSGCRWWCAPWTPASASSWRWSRTSCARTSRPIDVAVACATLIEDFGQAHGELAERLGRSRPAISNLVRLLELPEPVQAMIADGTLTRGPRPGDPHGRRPGAPHAGGRAGRRAAACPCARPRPSRAARAPPAPPAAAPRRARSPTAALEAFGAAFDAPVRVRPREGRSGGGRAPLRRRGRALGGARAHRGTPPA